MPQRGLLDERKTNINKPGVSLQRKGDVVNAGKIEVRTRRGEKDNCRVEFQKKVAQRVSKEGKG